MCVQTQSIMTVPDRRTDTITAKAAQDQMAFLLLLYWCHFNRSWTEAQSCTKHTHGLLHLHTNLVSTFDFFLSLEPQRSRLQNCPDYAFSLHQSSVLLSMSEFSSTSFLLASPPSFSVSLSVSLSPTLFKSLWNCTGHMTLTSQLEWQIGYNSTIQ